jgi:hypothetical protein
LNKILKQKINTTPNRRIPPDPQFNSEHNQLILICMQKSHVVQFHQQSQNVAKNFQVTPASKEKIEGILPHKSYPSTTGKKISRTHFQYVVAEYAIVYSLKFG